MALDASQGHVSWRVKRRFMSQYAPSHTRQLVGQGNGQFIAMHTLRCTREPIAKAEVRPSVRSHQNDLGRLNEQHPQVSAAALGDASQHRSATRTVLPWDRSQPSGKVSASVKSLTFTDGREHRCLDHRADTWDRHHIDAVLFGAADLFDLIGHSVDPVGASWGATLQRSITAHCCRWWRSRLMVGSSSSTTFVPGAA